VQNEAFRQRPLPLVPPLRGWVWAAMAALLLQIALGGWVSTNYAVLACSSFPACNGSYWPEMDFGDGFTLLRELGRAGHGGVLSFEALVAIHMAHRLFALAATLVLLVLSLRLWPAPGGRRFAVALAALLLAQLASGLSNVVLGWPLAAALAHSAGAAALVLLLTLLLARSAPGSATAA
jgi:cytochrome c oxidase assembly protein subunit 15